MRSRNIKPGFFHNEELVECSFPARLLFVGLWCLADRAGYLEDRPKKIKIQVFPADNVDSEELLGELSGANLIKRYIAADRKYIWIPGFRSHQNPHRREKPSTIPPHPDDAERRPAHEGEGTDPEDEKQGQDPSKDMPRTDQGQTQDEPGHGRARLIPDTGILIPDSLNPDSGNLKEKTLSDESDDGQPEPPQPKTPPCPYADIVALWNEKMPELPQVKKMGDPLKKKIRARWNGDKEAQTMGFWAGFLDYIRESDFLMGRTEKPFRASLDWICGPENWGKVYNGNYENPKAHTSPRQGRRLQGDELLQANTKAAEDF